MDDAINLPESKLAQSRSWHPERWVVVVASAEACADDDLATVQVVPCSGSFRLPVHAFDLLITHGGSAFTKECVAYVTLAQPILKSDIGAHRGTVTTEHRVAILARIDRLRGTR